jgi:hypothetical protein
VRRGLHATSTATGDNWPMGLVVGAAVQAKVVATTVSTSLSCANEAATVLEALALHVPAY